jgi:hypothetical protein
MVSVFIPYVGLRLVESFPCSIQCLLPSDQKFMFFLNSIRNINQEFLLNDTDLCFLNG